MTYNPDKDLIDRPLVGGACLITFLTAWATHGVALPFLSFGWALVLGMAYTMDIRSYYVAAGKARKFKNRYNPFNGLAVFAFIMFTSMLPVANPWYMSHKGFMHWPKLTLFCFMGGVITFLAQHGVRKFWGWTKAHLQSAWRTA
jgi:hypothetical protein